MKESLYFRSKGEVVPLHIATAQKGPTSDPYQVYMEKAENTFPVPPKLVKHIFGSKVKEYLIERLENFSPKMGE